MFLGIAPKWLFQSFIHIFPFNLGPNSQNQDQGMWSWPYGLDAKLPGCTIVRGDGSETHLGVGKQVITESLLCPFSVLFHTDRMWILVHSDSVMLAEFLNKSMNRNYVLALPGTSNTITAYVG